MRNVWRLLSLIYYALRAVGPGIGVVGVLLAWLGYFRWYYGHADGTLWLVLVPVILLLYLLARGQSFVCFAREDLAGRTLHVQQPNPVISAIAAGYFRGRGASGGGAADLIRPHTLARVQVRWLVREGRPPMIAALRPWDLDAKLQVPLARAEEYSLWYPGSEVETGLVYIEGREHPGVRLRFLGKQLLLALPNEEAAAQLAHALHSAESAKSA